MELLINAAFAIGTGYAVSRGEYGIASGIALFAMLATIGRWAHVIAHRVGILEGYLDGLLSKD